MTDITNKDRAERARAVLRFYRDTYESDIDDQTVLTDVLADVLHLEDQASGEDEIDVEQAFTMARVHFNAEVSGED